MTAIRQQYLKIKQRYPQVILLFRLGDFYEAFDDDAETVSREVEITLTSREMGKGRRYPMAGIPHHALDSYLARLIHKGYKVAICEQLADPRTVKGIVPRGVVRVVTPGTVLEPNLLERKSNNYLAALALRDDEAGLAYVDVSTGEFAATQLPRSQIAAELARLVPAEVLLSQSVTLDSIACPITHLEPEAFDPGLAQELLLRHLGAATLEGYGLAGLPLAIGACGAILRYLEDTQKSTLALVQGLTTYSTSAYMALDAAACHNLELFQVGRLGESAGSLLSLLDLTKTSMGGRLLKRWLGQPLLDVAQIESRQEMVAWFHSDSMRRARAQVILGKMADLERLVNRARSGLAYPRELVALRHSLEAVPTLQELVADDSVLPQLKPCPEVASLIAGALADDPSPLGEGNVIRPGFSPEMDRLRALTSDVRGYLAGLERKERERTGIKSLKIAYNKVFGYYIEVTAPNLHLVPQDYIRKQTIAGGERYFTPELKEFEASLLSAQEQMAELESSLFRQVCRQVGDAATQVLGTASAIAIIDVAVSLAEAAVRYGFVRPQVDDGPVIDIKGGRHPTVERAVVEGNFVANDTYLSNKDAQLVILTGPNMSGKSTYIRQVALIVLIAQIGGFIPADSAHIGVVDRIFTRVGLQDDLVTGQSTFMVEMVETANILNNATPRSLIILDEIGRGTSTYDGLSIARAVAEYIHNSPRLGAKTLFATHYHELVELAQVLPRARNFNVAVAEERGKVVFLHKIVPGGADRSYGIHVAQMAGLPRPVLHRAEEVLEGLEKGSREAAGRPRRDRRQEAAPPEQKPLLPATHPLLEELKGLEVDGLTPLEALTKLYELKRKAREQR
ncbi:MAG: DNA mismatch repair protein MutS [Chloroflexi bacterium]|nr:DNA mismatch repair protein MutS [Chloroflexota bacterium]